MTDRTDAPLAAPRDIEGVNPSATFVRCPDCNGAIFNLRNQRQGHLKWHDDLDADVAAAQEATTAAQEAAERAERALAATRSELAELQRILAESRPAAAAVPLIGEWPADEIAERIIIAAPGSDAATAGEPEPDLDLAPAPHTAGPIIDEDDDPDVIDFPQRRF